MRRLMKWMGRTFLWLGLGVGGLVILVLIGLSTDAGNEFIRQEALKAAAPSLSLIHI